MSVAETLGDRKDGVFLEVGAGHPTEGSQTWPLEQLGWTGVLVEANPRLCRLLREQRKGSRVFEAACSSPEKRGRAKFHLAAGGTRSTLDPAVDAADVRYPESIEVELRPLDEILDEAGVERVDFVSIDVEGTELDVLRGFDLGRFRPSLIVIEDKLYTLGKHRFLKRHGYRLLRRRSVNNWYVPREADPRPSLWERFRLFRKLYLGFPFRKIRLRSRRRRVAKRGFIWKNTPP